MTGKDAMLAAHVQFELQQYAPEQLQATLRVEIAALYEWLGQVKVNKLVQPELALAWIQRNVVERPLPTEVVDFIQENIVVALEMMQEDQTRVDAIVPKAVYDQVVESIAMMQDMRQQLTHQVVTSSIYSRLLSNVLYHGIKCFLVSEQGVARSIPGAAAFMRMGQTALNAAAPEFEKNVDKQLVTFINDNMQQLIADSESFLNRTLDDALIRKVGAELWETTASDTPAHLAGPLDKQALSTWAGVAQDMWIHLRTTELFQDIVKAIVRSFSLRYGKQDMRTLLEQIGLSQEVAVQEASHLAAPLAEHALASGYLEARIRKRLQPFYDHYFADRTLNG